MPADYPGQLDGKTIFITGSGGVLGRTYVRRMLEAGAQVIASDLPGARAEQLKADHGARADFSFVELDVADEEQVTGVFGKLLGMGL